MLNSVRAVYVVIADGNATVWKVTWLFDPDYDFNHVDFSKYLYDASVLRFFPWNQITIVIMFVDNDIIELNNNKLYILILVHF